MGWYNFTTGITASEEVTTSETLSSSTQLVLVDATLGNVVLTLPAATDNTRTAYTIKKIDSSNHTVTIDANSAETIDGELTIVLKLQYAYITIICDGTEWWIIGGEYVKMEDILEKKFNEQINLLERIRREVNKSTLHLASATEENITDEDTD